MGRGPKENPRPALSSVPTDRGRRRSGGAGCSGYTSRPTHSGRTGSRPLVLECQPRSCTESSSALVPKPSNRKQPLKRETIWRRRADSNRLTGFCRSSSWICDNSSETSGPVHSACVCEVVQVGSWLMWHQLRSQTGQGGRRGRSEDTKRSGVPSGTPTATDPSGGSGGHAPKPWISR